MSGSAVRQGGVFIEIGADPSKLFAALNKVNARVAAMGRQLANAGGSLTGIGMAAAAPFVAAATAGARFDDVMRNIKASTNATPAELDAVKKASMEMSEQLGIGPTEAAQGMLALLKAGTSLEDVLGGVGQAAIEFAKVGELDVTAAAETMKDAMNVFGVSASTVANTLSAAADGSTTSIESMTQSFSMSAAVAGLANQSIGDLSTALAILANNGVKGSDAGTSIKTMLLRLMAPADDAVAALSDIGLTIDSFRDSTGQMLPMVDLIRIMTGAMGDLDQAAKDDIMRRVFGSDAIRAAAILTSEGVAGFENMQGAMAEALPVGEKFKILMGGMSGSVSAILGSLERLAIAVSDAIAPALSNAAGLLNGFISGLARLASNNKEAVMLAFNLAAGTLATGAAMIVVGKSIAFASGLFGGLLSVVSAITSPLGMVARLAVAAGGSFVAAAGGIASGASAAASSLSLLARSAGSGLSAIVGMASSGVSSIAALGGGFGQLLAAQYRISSFIGGTFSSVMTRTLARTAMQFSGVRAAVVALGPAFSFVATGVAAVASDAARLASPFTRAVVGVQAWASAAATAAAEYLRSVYASVAATVSGAGRIAYAWISQAASAVSAFVSRAATSLGAYIGGLAAAAAATLASAGRIAASYTATMLPATTAFVAKAVTSLGTYLASVTASAAASVAGGARIAASWVAAGLPGVLSFVSGALAAFGGYIAAVAGVVATSVASGAAVAAAWLAPLAPFALLAAAIAGAGAAAFAFSGSIKSGLSSVGSLAQSAGDTIGTAFNGALAEATAVFGDMASTAQTAFSGISAAITNGDIWGALEILWAGVQAIWLRGQESVMNAMDPWIVTLQNTFTYLHATVATTWETLWTALSNTLNTAKAVLFGVFDNIVNGIMATWDTLEAGVRKAWIRVTSMFSEGKDTKAQLDAVDSEMSARAAARQASRPGVSARLDKASQENAANTEASQKRVAEINATADQTATGRIEGADARRQSRRDATMAADQRVSDLTQKQTDTKQGRETANDLISSIGSAETMDELRTIAAQIHELNSKGLLTEDQMNKYNSAADAATERISSQPTTPENAAGNGGKDAAESKSDVAGTFSALAIGGMGIGSTINERIAKASERTAQATEQMAASGGSQWSE